MMSAPTFPKPGIAQASQRSKVLVCGAGIAGPTLAYWLNRGGFEPTLLERAPALREGGYLVDFWGLGFDVAERMGLVPALRAVGCTIEEVVFVDEEGRRVGGFDARSFASLFRGRYISLLRSDLSRLVYESLRGEVRTVFHDSVAGIEQRPDGVEVLFASGASEAFDLVIGAGGLHSPVRRIAFGPERGYEAYLGYYAASFSSVNYPWREPGRYVSHSAPGRQVSRYALRDRTVFFFVFAADRKLPIAPHALEAQKELLKRTFAGDGWEISAMLSALDGSRDLYFDAVSQIRMPAWSCGRVALVGDACSCPSLLAGQGASLAMAEAYVLAGELRAAAGDHAAAFGRYEALLHPLIRRKQRAARRFASSFAPRTRLGLALRDRLSRFMSFPSVAKLAMGSLLSDSISLPRYEALDAPAGR